MTDKTTVDPATPEGVRARAQLTNNVLPVLVARAGGSVEIPIAEFAEITARYGGPSQMGIRFTQIDGGRAVRVELFKKPARQGELPV